MGLLNDYGRYGGYAGAAPRSRYFTGGFDAPAPVQGPSYTPPTSSGGSQPVTRTVPERLRVDDMLGDVTGNDDQMALQMIGRAPGYVLGAPIAGVQTAGKVAGLDIMGFLGDVAQAIPFLPGTDEEGNWNWSLGGFLGQAGRGFTNAALSGITMVHQGINAWNAETIKRAQAGRPDDIVEHGGPLRGVQHLLGWAGQETNAEFLARMGTLGWTSDEMTAIGAGRDPWSFGTLDKRLNENVWLDLAMNLALDPMTYAFPLAAARGPALYNRARTAVASTDIARQTNTVAQLLGGTQTALRARQGVGLASDLITRGVLPAVYAPVRMASQAIRAGTAGAWQHATRWSVSDAILHSTRGQTLRTAARVGSAPLRLGGQLTGQMARHAFDVKGYLSGFRPNTAAETARAAELGIRGRSPFWEGMKGYASRSTALRGTEFLFEQTAEGLDALLGDEEGENTALGGFTENLREFGHALVREDPIGTNLTGMVIAGFIYPGIPIVTEALGVARGPGRAAAGTVLGAIESRTRRAATIDDIPNVMAFRRLFAPDVDYQSGPKAAKAADELILKRLGGRQSVWEMYNAAVTMLVHEHLIRGLPSEWRIRSIPHVAARAQASRAVYQRAAEYLISTGRITDTDIQHAIMAMDEGTGGFDLAKAEARANGASATSGPSMPWDPELAAHNWVRFQAAWQPIRGVLTEVGVQVTPGIREYLPKETISDIRSALLLMRQGKGKDAHVTARDVQRILRDHPQFIGLDPSGTYWQQFVDLAPDAPVKWSSIGRKLKNMEDRAPSWDEVMADVNAHEAAGGSTVTGMGPEPLRTENLALQDGRVSYARALPGEARVAVSRYNPEVGPGPTTFREARAMRANPVIRAAERTIGAVLHESGVNVQQVHQTIGGWATRSMPLSELRAMSVVDLDAMAASPNHAADIAKLAKSIEAEGLREPLEIRVEGGKRYLAEGNHRLLALESLGRTDADVTMPAGRPIIAREPSLSISMGRSATLEETRLTAAMTARKMGQAETLFWVTGDRLNTMDVKPNAALGRITNIPRRAFARVEEVLHRRYGDGYTFDDTAGEVIVFVPDAEVAALIPDLEATLREANTKGTAGAEPAYVDFIGSDEMDTIIRGAEASNDVRLTRFNEWFDRATSDGFDESALTARVAGSANRTQLAPTSGRRGGDPGVRGTAGELDAILRDGIRRTQAEDGSVIPGMEAENAAMRQQLKDLNDAKRNALTQRQILYKAGNPSDFDPTYPITAAPDAPVLPYGDTALSGSMPTGTVRFAPEGNNTVEVLREVPVDQITWAQDVLQIDSGQRMRTADLGQIGYGRAILIDGQIVLKDGHHRLNEAMQRGEGTIKVWVGEAAEGAGVAPGGRSNEVRELPINEEIDLVSTPLDADEFIEAAFSARMLTDADIRGRTLPGAKPIPESMNLPEPGTVPKPDPKLIRAYHYTRDIDRVQAEGLDVKYAKGETYGEPNAIWFSTTKPDVRGPDFVEVFLDPAELDIGAPNAFDPRFGATDDVILGEIARMEEIGSNFTVRTEQITPDRFVTVSRPRQDNLRTLMREYGPETERGREALASGEMEFMRDWEGREATEFNAAVDVWKETFPPGALAEFEVKQRYAAAEEQVLYNAVRDAEIDELFPQLRYDRSTGSLSPEDLAAIRPDYHYLMKNFGGAYDLKVSPEMSFPTDSVVPAALKVNTLLGQWLREYGPASKVMGMVDWFLAPVDTGRQARLARSAMYKQLVPRGATAKQVDRWVDEMSKMTGRFTVGPLRLKIFRDATALTPSWINEAAAKVFPEDVLNGVGRDNFHIILDRSANRFIRDTMFPGIQGGRQGGSRGRLQRLIADGYYIFQTGDIRGRVLPKGQRQQVPGLRGLAEKKRIMAKTVYPIFRFMLDPRWHAMNRFEYNILSAVRDGKWAPELKGRKGASNTAGDPIDPVVTTAADVEQLPKGAQRYAQVDPNNALLDIESLGGGMLHNREAAGLIGRIWKSRSIDDIEDVVNRMPEMDGALRDLMRLFPDDDTRPIYDKINDFMYEMDMRGARETVTAEAQRMFGIDVAERLEPMLNQIADRHQQTFEAITHMLQGNPARNNLERIMNSYWLYWPISYQLKAGKWLFEVLTQGAGGTKTNFGGASWMAYMTEKHIEKLATDPEYQQFMEDHEGLFLAATMMIPITPFDLGVSLNRGVRGIGGHLGFWEEYKRAQDPMTFATWLAELGPLYSIQLASQVYTETFGDRQRKAQENERSGRGTAAPGFNTGTTPGTGGAPAPSFGP